MTSNIRQVGGREPFTNGILIAPAVNFKTTQAINIALERNSRYLLNQIRLVTSAASSISNGATVIVQEVDLTTPTAATLSTTMTGANNDIVGTAVDAGVSGNDITLALVDPSGNDEVLAIVVTGTDIVVNLATDGSGVITTTATELLAALAADEDASALATFALKGSDTGAGVVTALTETAFSGGLAYTVVQGIVDSVDLADTDPVNKVQSLTLVGGAVTGGNHLRIDITAGTATVDTKDIAVDFTHLG